MADHLKLPPQIPLDTKRIRQRRGDAGAFDYAHHASTLRGVLEGLESSEPGIFAGEEEIDASEIGEIVLKFVGASTFQTSSFKTLGMIPLALNDGKRYFAMTDAQARQAFKGLADSYIADPEHLDASDSLRSALRNLEGVELYGPEDRLGADLPDLANDSVAEIEVSLWPTSIATRGAEAEGRRRVAAVVKVIQEQAGVDSRVHVLAVNDSDPDLLLVFAVVNHLTLDLLSRHAYIESLHGPVAVRTSHEDFNHVIQPSEPVMPEGAPIGVIDDLVVTANPWLEDVVVGQRSFPDGFPFGQHTSHGTQVAGLAAWGTARKLLSATYSGQPHPIYLARVAQANSAFDTQIVGNPADQLRDALDWLASEGVRIVVLALNESRADDAAIPSYLSAIVDEKIREHGLVVVCAAGNITSVGGDWKTDYPSYLGLPSSKVAAPGTAASAITVGAVAHSHAINHTRHPNGIWIARKNEIAPYSRSGPVRGAGASGQQKPEFSANGGSWVYDQATTNVIPNDAEVAAVTLIPPVNGRSFGAASGTSFAAPLVAHETARIKTRYPDASANLLRALTGLAGDGRPTGHLRRQPFISAVYGIPNADRVLESQPNRVFFTFEGTISANSHAVIELPIPEEYAYGASERELRVALAFDPPVRRSRRDYIAGHMRFEFIQRESLEEIKRSYARQPTAREREQDASLMYYDRLPGQKMEPPVTLLGSSTLICRTYHTKRDGWDVDDEHYYLVITHEHSPWTPTQKSQYVEQRFAVAVEMADFDRTDIDLYVLAQARLAAQIRARAVS